MATLATWITSLTVFSLGASIGSFLNVVVYRLPAGRSLLLPPSQCPHCQYRLRPWENVPILSWLALRGQCSRCQRPIPLRYLLVEAATGTLFLTLFQSFGFSWQTLGYWTLVSWLLALSLIDLDTLLLPNALTKSGLLLGLLFQTVNGWFHARSPATLANQYMVAVIGAVLGIWLFEVIAWIGSLALGQTAMGGGDAKLAAMLGAWLGWQGLLLTGFLGCLSGAVVGSGAIALGYLDRRQPLPFGPFLALGAVLTLFWGEAILSAYLNLFLPTT